MYLAFDLDDRDQAMPAGEARRASCKEDAIAAAKALVEKHAGAVAWKRDIHPAVGESGDLIVLFESKRMGDFD